jgi:hypothetical protein
MGELSGGVNHVSPMDPPSLAHQASRYAPPWSGMGPVAQPVFKTGEVV